MFSKDMAVCKIINMKSISVWYKSMHVRSFAHILFFEIKSQNLMSYMNMQKMIRTFLREL
jgi:hypothetical protein